jgi:hypothetical protein
MDTTTTDPALTDDPELSTSHGHPPDPSDRFEDWSLERIEAELVTWAARENAAKARFLAVLGEFVRREGWLEWGCVSAAQWLSWHCGLGRVAAGEHIRVALALADLPLVSAGLERGELSWSKVRAVTRVAEASTDALWAEWAREATAAQLEKLVASARRIGVEDVEAQEERSGLSWRQEGEGSVVFTWRVTAEVGAGVIAAVESAARLEAEVPVARSRGGALLELVLGDEPVAAEVVVHVDDPEGTAVTEHGLSVPIEVAGVGVCDGVHSVVVHQPDEGLLVSDRRRAPTGRTRRAVEARDRWCRMPGCHHQARLEVHHIEHYHRGGSRRLDNLVRLCGAHHRLVHRLDLRLGWGANGELLARLPDGVAYPARPEPRPVAGPVPEPPGSPSAPWDGRPLDHVCIDAALVSLLPRPPQPSARSESPATSPLIGDGGPSPGSIGRPAA